MAPKLKEFERDLKNNLYKIWNRMSSGSYFPPPVKAVPIPKKSGGVRVLGVPTVSDRIAQMERREYIAERRFWNQNWNRSSTRIRTGTGRTGQPMMPSPLPENGAGDTTGWWNLTSVDFSTIFVTIC